MKVLNITMTDNLLVDTIEKCVNFDIKNIKCGKRKNKYALEVKLLSA